MSKGPGAGIFGTESKEGPPCGGPLPVRAGNRAKRLPVNRSGCSHQADDIRKRQVNPHVAGVDLDFHVIDAVVLGRNAQQLGIGSLGIGARVELSQVDVGRSDTERGEPDLVDAILEVENDVASSNTGC